MPRWRKGGEGVWGPMFVWLGRPDAPLPSVCVKLSQSRDEAVAVAGAAPTTISGLGQWGWMTVALDRVEPALLFDWIEESYRNVAPRRLVERLDVTAVADVRRAVVARAPVDERERGSVARTLEELGRLPDPFSEHADSVHVTASAVVVGPRGVLLHLHKRLGLWLQPGGHIEPGESPLEAACREVREETGLDPAPRALTQTTGLVHIDVHAGANGHTHLDLRYLFDGGDADPKPPPGESPDVRWFGWDEAIAIADPGLVGALRALRPSATS